MLRDYKYTEKEIDQIVKSMTILVDTREQKNDHLLSYWDEKGIAYKRRALAYCDYSFYVPENPELSIFRDIWFDKEIAVERKNSLEEISGCFTQTRERFEKELTFAPPHKVILIENANYSDIINSNYDTQYNNKSFFGSIHSFWHKYNCPIFFMPENKYSGLFIRGYFEYYLRNYLK